jgi:hypothetical protein
MGATLRAFPQDVVIEHYAPDERDPDRRLRKTGRSETRGNVQATISREITNNTELQLVSYNMYFPAGTEISGYDRVLVDGLTIEVFGPGRTSTDFAGRAHHVEAAGRLSE